MKGKTLEKLSRYRLESVTMVEVGKVDDLLPLNNTLRGRSCHSDKSIAMGTHPMTTMAILSEGMEPRNNFWDSLEGNYQYKYSDSYSTVKSISCSKILDTVVNSWYCKWKGIFEELKSAVVLKVVAVNNKMKGKIYHMCPDTDRGKVKVEII